MKRQPPPQPAPPVQNPGEASDGTHEAGPAAPRMNTAQPQSAAQPAALEASAAASREASGEVSGEPTIESTDDPSLTQAPIAVVSVDSADPTAEIPESPGSVDPTAAPAPGTDAPPLYIDRGPALPERIGSDFFIGRVQGPTSVALFWELTPASLSSAGVNPEALFNLHLKVWSRDRQAPYFDEPVRDKGEVWVSLPPGTTGIAALGHDRPDDGFEVIRWSRPFTTPDLKTAPGADIRFGLAIPQRESSPSSSLVSDPFALPALPDTRETPPETGSPDAATPADAAPDAADEGSSAAPFAASPISSPEQDSERKEHTPAAPAAASASTMAETLDRAADSRTPPETHALTAEPSRLERAGSTGDLPGPGPTSSYPWPEVPPPWALARAAKLTQDLNAATDLEQPSPAVTAVTLEPPPAEAELAVLVAAHGSSELFSRGISGAGIPT